MPSKPRVSNNLPQAMKAVREIRGLTQEDFGLVSSRTYLSGLERGLKSPTLGKLEQIASVMQVHPLTLLALTYASTPSREAAAEVLDRVCQDLVRLWSEDV
jgi:transcriptional regulator with XRE-family HTH domain